MGKSSKTRMKEAVAKAIEDGNPFLANEITANVMVGTTMLIILGVMILCLICNEFGVFTADKVIMRYAVAIATVVQLPMTILNAKYAGNKKWLKVPLMIDLIIVCAILSAALGHNVTLVMVFPVVVSIRYFDEKYTRNVALITAAIFLFASIANGIFGIINLNMVKFPNGAELSILPNGSLRDAIVDASFDKLAYIKSLFLNDFIPRCLIFLALSVSCWFVASRGRLMIKMQSDNAKKASRIETELNLATNIQANMLPSIFPIFPEHKEFDIFASMQPAKEVGGDFYDIFMIGEDKMAFLIADVSGKGVPAALFMVIAKTLIKNYAQMGLSPGEVFTKANETLLEGNDANLFVTAWMAILDINTGDVTYSNAGHNPPIIKRANSDYEYLKSKPGFVLAGLDGFKYKDMTGHLDKESVVFLYTDGIPEATDINNNMYGEERLLQLLNSTQDISSKELVEIVKDDLDVFYGDAEQFDDITMVALRYNGSTSADIAKTKVFKAIKTELDGVIDFVGETLELFGCTLKDINRITLCVEEWFVNVASFAYKEYIGNCEITIMQNKDQIIIKFKDSGIEFNPLNKVNDGIKINQEEMTVSGMGINLVRNIMDSVEYKYVNSQNILTLTKVIKKENDN